MLQKRIVPEEAIFGQGYLNCSTSGLRTGSMVYLNGVFSAASGPSGLEGKPGYAPVSGILFDPLTTGAGANTKAFMMSKLFFDTADADKTKDLIVSGQGIICYSQGWFETDQYTGIVDGTTALGSLLYINGVNLCNNYLTTGSMTGQIARAEYWGMKPSYDSNYWFRAPVYIRLINY